MPFRGSCMHFLRRIAHLRGGKHPQTQELAKENKKSSGRPSPNTRNSQNTGPNIGWYDGKQPAPYAWIINPHRGGAPPDGGSYRIPPEEVTGEAPSRGVITLIGYSPIGGHAPRRSAREGMKWQKKRGPTQRNCARAWVQTTSGRVVLCPTTSPPGPREHFPPATEHCVLLASHR